MVVASPIRGLASRDALPIATASFMIYTVAASMKARSGSGGGTMKRIDRFGLLGSGIAAILTTAASARADTVVQIPMDSLLNARTVSTLSGNTVTIWTPGQGVDGGDGFATQAVMNLFVATYPTYFNGGNAEGNALPDDGTFPENTDHPLVVLPFSNTDPTTSPQTFQPTGTGMFDVPVPQATYSTLYLFMTSSGGGGEPHMTVTMKYVDGSTSVPLAVPLNDYDQALPANSATVTFFILAPGMHKWSGASNMYPYGSPGDNTGHEVTGVKLTLASTTQLTSFVINKPDGDQMLLWGATGIATSPVDAGIASSGTTTAGSASDASTGSTSGASTGSTSGASTSGAGATSGAMPASGSTSAAGEASGLASAGTEATAGTSSGGNGNPTSGSIAGSLSGISTTGSGSGASLGAGGSSGTATSSASRGSSGCSLSSGAASRLPIWASMITLCGMAVRRRRRAGGQSSTASPTSLAQQECGTVRHGLALDRPGRRSHHGVMAVGDRRDGVSPRG
jgi:hypothetical protein